MATRIVVVVLGIFLFVAFFVSSPQPTEKFGHGHSGFVWGHNVANPRPGVDCGSIDSVWLYNQNTNINIGVWVDDMTVPYGKRSGDSFSTEYSRKIPTKSGKTIEASVVVKDDQINIRIAGVTYRADDGLVFLIATDDRPSPVLQLKVDTDKFSHAVYRNTLIPEAWLKQYPDAARFFRVDRSNAAVQ